MPSDNASHTAAERQTPNKLSYVIKKHHFLPLWSLPTSLPTQQTYTGTREREVTYRKAANKCSLPYLMLQDIAISLQTRPPAWHDQSSWCQCSLEAFALSLVLPAPELSLGAPEPLLQLEHRRENALMYSYKSPRPLALPVLSFSPGSMLLAASSIWYCCSPDSRRVTALAYNTSCSEHLCSLPTTPELFCGDRECDQLTDSVRIEEDTRSL